MNTTTTLVKKINKIDWNKFVEPKKQILVTKNGITTATLVNI